MKKKITFSVFFSVVVILLSYLVGNTSYPMTGEKATLENLNILKSFFNLTHDSVPDDVLLINVAFDKVLTDYYEEGMPIGQLAITDRKKLLDFLNRARKADNYKYIMMDVILEQGIETEYDSALFCTIASMPRIVIPTHEDVLLQDSILNPKAANADYSITQKETNFSHFQFVHDEVPSMPLKLYEAVTGRTIERHWCFYSCDGRLCTNGLTLKLPIRTSGTYTDKDSLQMRGYVYLGADVLNDSIIPVSEQIDGKIVVIGDFNNDVHRTYAGVQPGSVICLNAYYALMRGEHYVNYVFYIILFFVYTIITFLIFKNNTADAFFDNPWLKAIASFFTLTAILSIIAVIVYATPMGIVYNPVVPSAVFTILGTVLNARRKLKEKKEEINNKNNMTRCLFLLLTLTSALSVSADRYKIVSMNYPVLHINGKAVKVGYVFNDKATIKWSRERQAIRVFNLNKKKHMLMVARTINPKGNSIKEILTENVHLSTHAGYDAGTSNELRRLQSAFDMHYDLLDRIEIVSPVPLSDKQYFQATYCYGDKRFTKRLKYKGKNVIIDKSIFNVDGRKLAPRDIELDINYFDQKNNKVTFVKAGISIYVIPDRIK